MCNPSVVTSCFFLFLCTSSLLLGGTGCSKRLIPNTPIEDTQLNREVLSFVDSYRRAVESRNVPLLLSMTSESYFDDMGTPIGDDDVDYVLLKQKLLYLHNNITDSRYQIRYRSVAYVDNRIFVDILYTGWFQINTNQGPQWRRRLEPHRLVLVREHDKFKILSGM